MELEIGTSLPSLWFPIGRLFLIPIESGPDYRSLHRIRTSLLARVCCFDLFALIDYCVHYIDSSELSSCSIVSSFKLGISKKLDPMSQWDFRLSTGFNDWMLVSQQLRGPVLTEITGPLKRGGEIRNADNQ